MADQKYKSHSKLGTRQQWQPENRDYLELQVGKDKNKESLWPAMRQSIAEYRSGASKTAPKASSIQGYDFKTAEDQAMLQWIMTYLTEGQPNPPGGSLQYKGSTATDPYIEEAVGLAGG